VIDSVISGRYSSLTSIPVRDGDRLIVISASSSCGGRCRDGAARLERA